VQFLYGNEAQGSVEVTSELLAAFWELRDAKPIVREFAEELIHGVTEHLDEIDATIRTHLENYTMQRLTAVDRSILRLGAYEVIFSSHIPPQAAINEAIEIAKRFATEDSPGFVNGILDRILKR
jgi:N utilization substance protein B